MALQAAPAQAEALALQALGVDRADGAACNAVVVLVDLDAAPVGKGVEREGLVQAVLESDGGGGTGTAACFVAGVSAHARCTTEVQLFGRVEVAVCPLGRSLQVPAGLARQALLAAVVGVEFAESSGRLGRVGVCPCVGRIR